MLKLTDLNAKFVDHEERRGVAVELDCPCRSGKCVSLIVPFSNPLDGGKPLWPNGWQRTGDTLETLTLRPSVLRMGERTTIHCSWHGFITNGEAVTV